MPCRNFDMTNKQFWYDK